MMLARIYLDSAKDNEIVSSRSHSGAAEDSRPFGCSHVYR